jgi:ribose 1,5-bisphosphokinase PhnN
MLSAKMDLLMKRLDERAREKKSCIFMIPAWLVKSVETLGIQAAVA